jgi:transcriptional regulator with XRE-family HTH domain
MTLLRTQLGNTLRGHRLRQRRTLRDVSGAARVSLGYLSEVERGQKEASSELLASICDALDVELADLLAEVSLEMRLAEPARRTVRPVALAGVGAGGGAGARPGTPDDDPAAAAVDESAEPGPAVIDAPVAEPALALVGGGQPARSAARPAGAVCLAA